MPGAVYVGVKRAGHLRIAVTVGRFTPFWDKALPEKDASRLKRLGVDEVHVHLLARGSEAADGIMKDLSSALGETRNTQELNETASSWVHAA